MPPPNEAKPTGMSPFEVIVDVFGGIRSVARVLDIAPSTVMRWGEKPEGIIPHAYMRPLIEEAAKTGRRLTIEEVVWGRTHVTRTVVKFDEPPSPLGQMAKTLTRFACSA